MFGFYFFLQHTWKIRSRLIWILGGRNNRGRYDHSGKLSWVLLTIDMLFLELLSSVVSSGHSAPVLLCVHGFPVKRRPLIARADLGPGVGGYRMQKRSVYIVRSFCDLTRFECRRERCLKPSSFTHAVCLLFSFLFLIPRLSLFLSVTEKPLFCSPKDTHSQSFFKHSMDIYALWTTLPPLWQTHYCQSQRLPSGEIKASVAGLV